MPEAKLQLALTLDDYNTFVMRSNLNYAKFNSLDYFYIDSKDFLPQLKDTPYTLSTRVGRFKLPFGEEQWTNNIAESAVGSNSAANVAGYDEGAQVSGSIGKENPWKWWLAVSNGNGGGSGTTAGTVNDNMAPKAYSGRLGYSPIKPLWLSGSFFTSGGLGASSAANTSCDVPFANLYTGPTGAGGWSRTLWEGDARWDFEKGKIANATAFTDSKAYLMGAFGQLYDNADVVSDREANYGFVEGLYNFHPKIYGAFRFSVVNMRRGANATLNSIANVTGYDRYSLGFGYRCSDKVILKVTYDFNVEQITTGNDTSDDQLMVALVTLF